VLPAVKPVIDIGEDDPVAEKTAPLDESVAYAVYPVTVPEGAVKVIERLPELAVAVPIVGGLGTNNGKYEAVKTPA
jgi:hypothetical protein